jgi:hypothetical protein
LKTFYCSNIKLYEDTAFSVSNKMKKNREKTDPNADLVEKSGESDYQYFSEMTNEACQGENLRGKKPG